MDFGQVYLIAGGVLAGLLFISLIVLFFVSRRSQKVMKSLLDIMIRPERARVQDAVRVLNAILADEMIKMESNFQNIRDELNAQIGRAEFSSDRNNGRRNKESRHYGPASGKHGFRFARNC